ncbi:1,4-alpha-glucan branching enzyme GlgB [compost metagenome]
MLQYAPHKGMQQLVKALNLLYKEEPALYRKQFSAESFEWLNADDLENSVYVYMRKTNRLKDTLIVVLNVTPVYRTDFRVGVPKKGVWKEIFNTDDPVFYGSGKLNEEPLQAEPVAYHHHQQSMCIMLPPLGLCVFKLADRN